MRTIIYGQGTMELLDNGNKNAQEERTGIKKMKKDRTNKRKMRYKIGGMLVCTCTLVISGPTPSPSLSSSSSAVK
ncbi:unnamed protein product [Enterobius vermicularis]|uniref:Uncharacterized protein n=1 Tax=Enterobius vermicularis TaxID=51028 RepID=A0A0N4V376_ENTVE|nr:unnamed protein product [Enterobius vermicularis]